MFQNWREISRIPDRNIRTGVALIDPESKYGKVVVAKFPECFQSERTEDTGPIPLSVLIEKAREQVRRGEGDPTRYLVCYGGANDIPVVKFCLSEDCDGEFPLLPDELWKQIETVKKANKLHVGQSFTLEDKELVLLEMSGCGSGGDDAEFYFAPSAAVMVDITVHYDRPHFGMDYTDEPSAAVRVEGEAPSAEGIVLDPPGCIHDPRWWQEEFPKLSKEKQAEAVNKATTGICVFCRRAFFLGYGG